MPIIDVSNGWVERVQFERVLTPEHGCSDCMNAEVWSWKVLAYSLEALEDHRQMDEKLPEQYRRTAESWTRQCETHIIRDWKKSPAVMTLIGATIDADGMWTTPALSEVH